MVIYRTSQRKVLSLESRQVEPWWTDGEQYLLAVWEAGLMRTRFREFALLVLGGLVYIDEFHASIMYIPI